MKQLQEVDFKVRFLNTGDSLKDENTLLKQETFQSNLGIRFTQLKSPYKSCVVYFLPVNKEKIGWE